MQEIWSYKNRVLLRILTWFSVHRWYDSIRESKTKSNNHAVYSNLKFMVSDHSRQYKGLDYREIKYTDSLSNGLAHLSLVTIVN
jgi:hypothetical protein